MAAPVSKFLQQRGAAKAAGIAIVRNIFKTQEFTEGVSTKHLYKLALQEPAPPGFEAYPIPRPPQRAVPKTRHGKSKIIVPEARDLYPSNPDHPIRSIRFLKKEVLVALKEAKEITTIRQPKAGSRPVEIEPTTKRERKQVAASQMEFVWKVMPPQPNLPPPEVKKDVYGREVGVGADYSHLNKRRQRARVEKVSASVQIKKAIEAGAKRRTLQSRPLYRKTEQVQDNKYSAQ